MASGQRSIWMRILIGIFIVVVVAVISFLVTYFIARHYSAACITLL